MKKPTQVRWILALNAVVAISAFYLIFPQNTPGAITWLPIVILACTLGTTFVAGSVESDNKESGLYRINFWGTLWTGFWTLAAMFSALALLTHNTTSAISPGSSQDAVIELVISILVLLVTWVATKNRKNKKEI